MPTGCAEFLEQIRRYYDYLFDQYGFTVVQTWESRERDYCLVILKSDGGLLRFEKDLNSVEILLGPPDAPLGFERVVHGTRYWYSLRPLLEFLKGEPAELKEILRRVESFSSVEEQLEELSEMLKPACEQLLALFRGDAFKQLQQEFERFGEEQEKRFREQYEQSRRSKDGSLNKI